MPGLHSQSRPPPPIGFIPSVSLFWDLPGLHLPLRNLPDCWSMPPLMLLTLCPHTLSLVPQTITQSPPGLMPNIYLPTALLPALLPIVKLVGLILSGIPSSCLLSTGDLSLLIALVSSLTPLLRSHHPQSAVRLVGPFFHCQQGSSGSMQVSHPRCTVLSFRPCCTVLPAQAYTSPSLCTRTACPDIPRKQATPSRRDMPPMSPMPAHPLLMRPLPSPWFSLMTHIRDSHSHLHWLLCPELGEPIVTTAVIQLWSTKRQY